MLIFFGGLFFAIARSTSSASITLAVAVAYSLRRYVSLLSTTPGLRCTDTEIFILFFSYYTLSLRSARRPKKTLQNTVGRMHAFRLVSERIERWLKINTILVVTSSALGDLKGRL